MSLLLPQRNLNPQIIQSLLLHLENCIIFWASLSKFKMDATWLLNTFVRYLFHQQVHAYSKAFIHLLFCKLNN